MCFNVRIVYVTDITIYYDLSIGNGLKNNYQQSTAYRKWPMTSKLTWIGTKPIYKIHFELN